MKIIKLFLILFFASAPFSFLNAEDVEPVNYQPLPTPYNVGIGVFTSCAEKPLGQPLGFIQNRIIQDKAIRKPLDKDGKKIPLLFQVARYYRGLPTSLVCGGISTGVEIAAKEKISAQFNPNSAQLTAVQKLVSGGAAGAISALIDPAIETVTLRQQNKDKSLAQTLTDIWNIKPSNNVLPRSDGKQSFFQGIRNFYQGSGAILTRNTLSACGNWALFDVIRQAWTPYISNKKANTAVAATFTGVAIATATHPFTFAKTRLQGDIEKIKYQNTFDVWKKAIKTEGIFSIFKGYIPRTIRAIIASAVMFNTQDWLKTNAQQSYRAPKTTQQPVSVVRTAPAQMPVLLNPSSVTTAKPNEKTIETPPVVPVKPLHLNEIAQMAQPREPQQRPECGA